MQPKYLDHIVIIVKDIERTEIFYTSFLGKPVQLEKDQVAYKVGDTKIFFGLAYGDYAPADKDKGGLNHLAFGVKTKEELIEFEKALNQSNIKNSGIKTDKYGAKEFIWFDDPSGIRLEFYCRPE